MAGAGPSLNGASRQLLKRQVERVVQRREPVLVAELLEREPMLGPDVGADSHASLAGRAGAIPALGFSLQVGEVRVVHGLSSRRDRGTDPLGSARLQLTKWRSYFYEGSRSSCLR